MYSFLSEIEVKVDAKGRIFFPAQYRKLLSKEGDETLVMRLDDDFDCINIYPQSVWDKEIAAIQSQLNMHDKDDRFFFMNYTRTASHLELDSNGRILIPKIFLQKINMNNDAVFVGYGDRIALWSKNETPDKMMTREKLADEVQNKLGNKSKE